MGKHRSVKNKMDIDAVYDRALLNIGQNGKFQKRFDIIYNVFLSGLWSMAYYNILLTLTIVPHHCTLPDRPQNISEDTWKLKYIPKTKDNNGENGFSSCLIYTSNNKTRDCVTYEYDKTWYASTITSDNNWFCGEELHVINILTFNKIGETLGSLFFGWFADTYGRKPAYIISLALLIFGRIIIFFASQSFTLLAIGCIISGFPATTALQSISVISIEISSPERRSMIAKLRFIASSFGLSVMPILYWWLKDWKKFLVLTTITQLPYLLMSWKMIESPQWLWVNRKNKKCAKELKHIGRINKTTLSSETESDILNTSLESQKDTMGLIALFSSRRLALNTTLQLFMWVSVTFSYTISLLTSGEKSDGNPFLEFASQSLAEIPAHFTAAWLADRLGRRFTGVIASGLTAVIWALFGLRSFGIVTWLGSGWISTVLGVVNRFSITISYYIINLFNMELYPTSLRQSGMSLGDVISGGASAISPYVLHMSHQHGILFSASVLSIISMLGALSAYYLPETINAKLPGTLDEARQFGLHN